MISAAMRNLELDILGHNQQDHVSYYRRHANLNRGAGRVPVLNRQLN